ncbi:succinyl-diaminopimelate desuccinylase [Arsenicicoccus sp. oral taxon 190]|uniref:succinyl-diaminopimelate desuccinylase n=1 Tax=Arsenicicoccus sp. oral taxon 190 TaxID=1658671 RepID=UPI00067A10B1|nr:succinyl-diaminopimelate desuccinylase [Arsenicicoccus sp. oral taxon 190]AKT51375.1 succinyl-diaminopimelate desuccinylase [Arsenicicoccus sp. oral taxon 190]
MTTPPPLDLTASAVDLTETICNIASVSHEERELADAVEAALRGFGHLRVTRDGNTVVARTELGRDERVVLAGHLDTVPFAGQGTAAGLPITRTGTELIGRGTTDMKGGVAVMLALAGTLPEPSRDLTYVFYDCEEVEAAHNGLARLARNDPSVLEADFAVLLEPTDGTVEGGCKGTLRVEVTARGEAAHSGRPWLGHNAIHEAGTIIDRLREFDAQTVAVDGLDFREGLSAVGIRGGRAGNVVPDECVVTVNYRFAPHIDAAEAERRMRALFEGYEVVVTDAADGARPGLDRPAAQAFVAALGLPVQAKQGWTDVARFSAVGVPAVNFGPGDPLVAHQDEERCAIAQVEHAYDRLRAWLS